MALGMEVELARPLLALDGGNLPGDTVVYRMPGLLRVVSDKRSIRRGGHRRQYSNVEFVADHFDQHAGSAADAEAQLRERLAVMDAIRGDLYRTDTERRLSAALTTATTALYTAFAARRYDPAVSGPLGGPVHEVEALVAPGRYPVPGNRLNILAHYTVGVAPELLGPALTWIAGRSRDQGDENAARAHAARAEAVGRHCSDLVPGGEVAPTQRPELIGYLALAFTQTAAFADIVAHSEERPDGSVTVTGQPKNYLAALSRVPLRTVFDALHADVRGAITAHADAIGEHIGDQVIPAFTDDDSRQVVSEDVELAAVTIGEYLASALGQEQAIEQQRVFGGMNETPLDPTVHGAADPDPAVGRGVPLELRLFGTSRPTWDVLVDEAVTLLTWSRTGAGLSDRDRAGSADYWLADITALLDAYRVEGDRVRGPVLPSDTGQRFAANWNASSLHTKISAVLRACPGFPGRERGPDWDPAAALADFTCFRRFLDLTQGLQGRIPGFDPEPFPPPFDFSGPAEDTATEDDMETGHG
jgi:hypothetical protein